MIHLLGFPFEGIPGCDCCCYQCDSCETCGPIIANADRHDIFTFYYENIVVVAGREADARAFLQAMAIDPNCLQYQDYL
uniref:Uncharacterized protein n=1 Tax=viral metagenome TaxID=1070528 RepID=A0A6M3IXV5_9ZZZZ